MGNLEKERDSYIKKAVNAKVKAARDAEKGKPDKGDKPLDSLMFPESWGKTDIKKSGKVYHKEKGDDTPIKTYSGKIIKPKKGTASRKVDADKYYQGKLYPRSKKQTRRI